MKRISIIFLLLFSILSAYAQRAELHFPHFAGQDYYFMTYRGMWTDTIAAGKLNTQGKATLVLPDKFKDYRGMSQWLLSGGGGLNIIFAGGEDFSISCYSAEPSKDNIIYTNTKENNYLLERYRCQQTILAKVDAMRMAVELYQNDGRLLPVLRSELEKQEQAYNELQKQTAADKHYAACFALIVDVTRGFPPVLGKDQQENNKKLKDFMLKEMDMDALYTSGNWLGVINQLAQWYVSNPEEKKNYLPDMKVLLKRILSNEVYAGLTDEVIAVIERYNWYNEQIELVAYLKADRRTDTTKGRAGTLLSMIKITNGQKASKLTQGELPTEKTILVFYESGCGNCTE